MSLEVENVTLGYGGVNVVHSVSFRLKPGELGCLLGPSGCGKTTLLRAVAGFEAVRAGAIRIDGEKVSAPGATLSPERRGVGMVFQDYALFPHLSIRDNIAFGLRGSKAAERTERVARLLDLIGLSDYGSAYPHELSGGQQQRVALARALAPRPRLLLLDEPFSGLDVERREELAREVRCILKEEGITALMVTHDQFEAFATADSIGVMSEGDIVQWDSGYNLYHRPASRFVADFIGQGELIPGKVTESGEIETELGVISRGAPTGCRSGCAVEVLIRPDDLIDCPTGTPARVEARAFRGADFLYQLSLPSGARVLCLTHSHNRYEVGERISVRPQVDHVVAFPVEPACGCALSGS